MSPKFKFYLKLFLAMAVPYGLLTGLVDYFSGDEISWWGLVFTMVFFGFFMSLILGSMHLARLKGIDSDAIEKGYLHPHQEELMHSPLTMEEIVDRLNTSDWRLRMQRENENLLRIKTKTSWWSWGEKIEIEWLGFNKGKNEYRVSSDSALKTTLADFGQNRKNIINLRNMLEVNKQTEPIA